VLLLSLKRSSIYSYVASRVSREICLEPEPLQNRGSVFFEDQHSWRAIFYDDPAPMSFLIAPSMEGL